MQKENAILLDTFINLKTIEAIWFNYLPDSFQTKPHIMAKFQTNWIRNEKKNMWQRIKIKSRVIKHVRWIAAYIDNNMFDFDLYRPPFVSLPVRQVLNLSCTWFAILHMICGECTMICRPTVQLYLELLGPLYWLQSINNQWNNQLIISHS